MQQQQPVAGSPARVPAGEAMLLALQGRLNLDRSGEQAIN